MPISSSALLQLDEVTHLLPIPTPVYVGEAPEFIRRMSIVAQVLPDVFRRLRNLHLDQAFLGLKKLEFKEFPEYGISVLSHYNRSTDTITVYPTNFTIGNSRVDIPIYDGFGERMWALRLDSIERSTWERKLISANKALMGRLSEILEHGHDNCFEAVLAQFKTPVERLQVIHVINAYKRNSVSRERARFLSIYKYAPIEPFANGRVPFSINPLLSAYYGPLDIRRYPVVFAKYCSFNGRLPVAEISVESALIELFKFVTFE